jgi:hypothetical protein
MKIVNLMPHACNVLNEDGSPRATIPPSGLIARVTATSTPVSAVEIDGAQVMIVTTTFGETTGLPSSEDGVLYVVSGLLAAANPHRKDLLVPGDQVRDPANASKVLGCKNLSFPNR